MFQHFQKTFAYNFKMAWISKQYVIKT